MAQRKVGKVVFSGRKNEYSEYVIRVYDITGREWEAANYYTDNKADVQATLVVMQRAVEIQDR